MYDGAMSGAYVMGSMVGAVLLALFVLLMVTNDEKQARRIVKILEVTAVIGTVAAIAAIALTR